MPTPSYEIPPEMRDLAEKSVDQARKAFESFIGAAQKAMGQADTTANSMQSSVRVIGDKAVTFTEQNVRSAFDYASRVVKVTDMQELMQLQSEYVKAQMSALQEQAKDIGSTVSSSFSKPNQG
ncbi:phasin [Lichenihabitans sp. Uapishka_5]|uniref:phasin n=1 Tax=Lichenihabitans sp. Uapishka_5 TaxID=3037302 RepID=UPI0029E7D3F9|nr:phasin [Lichenihabitans sp. Uapishka_5]MDX7952787.1 phasin [Lichenihabitans sp. Uapishka_5]